MKKLFSQLLTVYLTILFFQVQAQTINENDKSCEHPKLQMGLSEIVKLSSAKKPINAMSVSNYNLYNWKEHNREMKVDIISKDNANELFGKLKKVGGVKLISVNKNTITCWVEIHKIQAYLERVEDIVSLRPFLNNAVAEVAGQPILTHFDTKDEDSKEEEEREREEQEREGKGEKAWWSIERDQYEFDLLKDPATGKIPREAPILAANAAIKAKPFRPIPYAQLTPADLTVIPRGPTNLGGRTRALGIDKRNAQIMMAGSVSSGLYRSTNGGTSWTRVAPIGQIHNVTALAQDTRAGFEDTWYYGTGEAVGNSATLGSSYRGNGIWKSTDNGLTWSLLTATTAVLENFDSPFDYVHRIVVDPTNGNVYAAAGNSIQRSTDGGTTWTPVLGTFTGLGYTDIIVTPTGRLYASFVGTDTNEGVYTSTTGASGAWTKIAGTISAVRTPAAWNAANTYGRIVMAFAPSNPNVVFFLYWNGTTSSCAAPAPEAKLFKYVQSTNTFTDLSANLPDEAGCLDGNDPFAVQTGYDLLVTVKPDDENTIFVGGTNLYRSTSGFTNTTATKRIGGYNSPADYALYPNHHPDQHIAIFAPGDNNTIYSGNDGGIHKADATAATVVWTSLNNNYVTYQYYHVDIDPANGSAALMGGAQDNGTTAVQTGSNFSSVWSGDGCGTAIISYTSPTAMNAIVSSQSGNIRRLTAPNTAFNIRPTGSSSGFVTYFNLDQDNTNYLYFAGFSSLYRTRIARTISGTAVSGSATGWEVVPAGITGDIQCMSTSRNDAYAGATYAATDANRKLYIGTTNGRVFRLNDPAFTVSAAVNITPVGASGVCSSIAVNPDDDNEIMVTFANYNVNSVYHTLNANAATPTWTVVEGPSTGAVALGSARSSIITKIGTTKTYFVGSSTGLYSTQAMTGATTVWDRVGTNEINYAVCASMRLRVSDNRIVVGTHGNGMFELQLTVPPVITTQPVASTICAGANTSFSIVSATATSYKWQISNDNISANFVDLTIAAPYSLTNGGATLNITGAVTGLNGKYFRCVAINVAGSTNSTGVLLTVNAIPTATASSNTPICAGSTLNLSSNGGGTYAWTGVNSFTSSLQNPTILSATTLATGTYKVVVTNANGCTAMATTSATVNAIPTATASSNSPVCLGATLTLTGGGGTSYAWTGVNSFTSSLQSPTIPNVTSLAGGTYQVLVTNNGCTATAITSIVINPLPTATASSNPPVCEGGIVNLTSPIGFASYAWTGVNSFTSTLQNPTILNATTLATGTYKVVVTNANGCTAMATTSATVNAIPTATASSNTPICAGSTLNLSSSGGGTYAWTGVNSFTSSLQNPTILSATTLATGTYKVIVTNANGCTAMATTSATVNAIPTATASSNSPVCLGTTLTLTGGGGTSYAWTGVNSFTSTLQSPTIPNVTALATGTYRVVVTNNGCTATATVSAIINSLPTATASSNSPVCSGGNVNLTGGGGVSYAWTGTNSFTSSLQNPIIPNATTLATGTYQVLATNANGCTATATTSVIVNAIPATPTTQANTSIILGSSISLSATGCTGVLKWYETISNNLVTMPVSPTVNTQYYAKCEVAENAITCVGAKSNDVSVLISTTIVSAQTGNWETASTWVGGIVPQFSDFVIIDTNHIVTINSIVAAKSIQYLGTGEVKFSSNIAKLNTGF
jgi:hypothetical protein